MTLVKIRNKLELVCKHEMFIVCVCHDSQGSQKKNVFSFNFQMLGHNFIVKQARERR